MADFDIQAVNRQLEGKTPQEIVAWAIEAGEGQAVVTTNFRPYEAVLLHMCTQVQPDIRVLWADHGYNRPATYRHMEDVRRRLDLNIHAFVPLQTAAHRDAVDGPVPEPDDEAGLRKFSAAFKLEPFQRGMRALKPTLWLTALRKVQNSNREAMDIVTPDTNFGTTKVSPVFHWTDDDMEAYLVKHDLPNEWDYWDPAKADEKRECGLHAAWGGDSVK